MTTHAHEQHFRARLAGLQLVAATESGKVLVTGVGLEVADDGLAVLDETGEVVARCPWKIFAGFSADTVASDAEGRPRQVLELHVGEREYHLLVPAPDLSAFLTDVAALPTPRASGADREIHDGRAAVAGFSGEGRPGSPAPLPCWSSS
jgi:hypothetical protein